MQFSVSPAPHVIRPTRVWRTMAWVLAALVPAYLAHVVFFGPGVVVHLLIAAVFAVAAEILMLRLRARPLRPYISDLSALVTAALLAIALPPLSPWWLSATGAAFAVIVAKHLYGGLGNNIFNPAMAGYAVLIVSFPARMIVWPSAAGLDTGTVPLDFTTTLATIFTAAPPTSLAWDAITSATPLDAVRSGLQMGYTMQEIQSSANLGTLGSRGWDWIGLGTLAGGLLLLAVGVIRWHIPFAMLGAFTSLALVMHGIDPGTYAGVMPQLFSGATLLGAFFIATDPVSAATSNRGRVIYGAGIGTLAFMIRSWSTYPDGIAFAVLLMNLLTPLIDRYTIPRVYGHARAP